VAWQQVLKARAQKAMPSVLTSADSDRIKAKYSSQLQALQAQRVILEHQMRQSEDSVRASCKTAREAIDKEASAATTKTQSKIDDVRSRYSERLKALDIVRGKTDDEFKRGTDAIEEQTGKERKHLFALHWEQEKVRRNLREYSEISLHGYIRRLFGLA